MFNNNNEEDRGQVGIGTLIVFIALVLVAAIAAGVLINTADLLQSQAEQTGEESTDQVVNNVDIVSSTGVADGGGDNVEEIDLRVSKGPGSGNIDLGDATFRWVGETETETLTEGDDSISITDPQLTDQNDVAEVTIDADDLGGDISMGEGEEATLTITTESGGQTTEQIRVPDILEPDQGVDL